MTETINGALEIDYERGVIYFHDMDGQTRLRICRVPMPRYEQKSFNLQHRQMLDITHMVGASWS
ncbi:MAG TPA: hypothetical protein VLG09_05860 [Candidatus Saccharimonadales bacterium]|nr:hypothetical protein [Candidatus Saccharimonadales bacterium]